MNTIKNPKKHLGSLIILCCIILAACSTDNADSQNTVPENEAPKTGIIHRTINFDAQERKYILYVPQSYSGDEPVPLLIGFHGYTSTSVELLEYVDFRPIADESGFLLVYPQGSLLDGSSHWNVAGWTAGSTAYDVGYTEAILDALSSEYIIDQNRVYAMGHSNGGFMSMRLACELSDKIAAVVSVSGSMTPEIFRNCDPKRPISVMEIHGTADNSVSYDGAEWTLSIDKMLHYWVTNNGCDATPIINDLPHNPDTTNDTSVEHIQYRGCENGGSVEHYNYMGGWHEWLGTLDESGRFNADIDTAEAICAFLSRNSLAGTNE